MPINPVPLNGQTENKDKQDKKNSIDFVITEPLYTFQDVILPDETLKDINDLISMANNYDLIFNTWGLSNVIKSQRNITVLLYGKSGTGKTMTAHAIAHSLNKKLMLVNYAEIESKYVGETSKNLVALFDAAKDKDVIILFDEADALLSKRVTDMHSASDVSVNQTRSVLLQLLDDYDGIVLFTTNFISNLDSAFFRRIRMQIQFDLPDESMRKKIWSHYLIDTLPVSGDREAMIDELSEISGVTGSDIANAVLRAAISAAGNGKHSISVEEFKIYIDKIAKEKDQFEFDGYEVSSRKVSEEYVKEKLGMEDIEHGS